MDISLPSCPPDVLEQLGKITDLFQEALGQRLTGLYVYGSAALGRYKAGRSDLDIFTVMEGRLEEHTLRHIVEALLSLSLSPAPLSVSIASLDDLAPWEYPGRLQFHYSEYKRKELERCFRENQPIIIEDDGREPDLACHITLVLKESAAVLGPPAGEILPEIPVRDFRLALYEDAVFAATNELVAPMYAILTLPRILAYFETGGTISKENVGEFALQHTPQHLKHILRQMTEYYNGQRLDMPKPWRDDVQEYKIILLKKIEKAMRKSERE